MTALEDSMSFFDVTPGPVADGASGGQPGPVLERNLRAIARRAPRTAEQIRGAEPRSDARFVDTPEGVLSAAIVEGVVSDDADPVFTDEDPLGLDVPEQEVRERWLASRRRPMSEAERLADTVDLEANGGVCVLGFGLGYHCRALGERFGDKGVVVCFEPDVGLLRAVLERVDHSAWIESGHFVLLTDPDDRASLAAAVRGVEGVLTLGASIVDHPASVKRLGNAGRRFGRTFANVLRVTRTSIVTTLVQSEVTLRNMLMNLDRYATGRGVTELSGVASGRPAVVVSAGPSLARNIHELARPGVRDRFVIIATQTTLKPLLRAGVKPHFVTALDYHEISRRFYEGLTEKDVEGVTLIAESKANPAILDAFPGDVRCPSDERMRMLLEPGFPSSPGDLPSGATVAHLAYYLARHMGCDPVILVGQDLGFTDGQYYAAGAAIHDVWAGELGPFRTLEMFEWERIVRAKSLLHRRQDVLGRAIYADEQMASYLQQFEVEFAEDAARGRSVIDATEGGVAKRGAVPMKLAEALTRFGAGDAVELRIPSGPRHDPAERLPKVRAHIERAAGDSAELARLSRDAAGVLREMIERQGDQGRVNDLITRVYALRDEARRLEPAYGLVQFLNQTGALNRYRADRAIDLSGDMDEIERQRRQIERDIQNVEWLAMCAEMLEGLLTDAAGVLRGEREKTTRDTAPEEGTPGVEVTDERRVGVVLMGEVARGGLGLARRLDTGLPNGRTVLETTLGRVLDASGPETVIVATDDPAAARAAAGAFGSHEGVVFDRVDADRLRARTDGVAGSRRWSPASWRGGLGSVSAYDESLDLVELDRVMERHRLTDAVLVGLDWSLVDPGLISGLVEMSRGRQDGKRLAICQAVPGLGGLLIDRTSVTSLAGSSAHAGALATIGGVLGYVPIAPVADPIAKSFCVPVPPSARDLGQRLVADTPDGAGLIAGVLATLGSDLTSADAGVVAETAARVAESFGTTGPKHTTLELCTGRLSSGLFGRRLREAAGNAERRPIDVALALRLLEQLGGERPDALLTLHGVGDPVQHPAALELVRAAKAAGISGVHVRTDLIRREHDAGELLASGVDVVSVDVLATEPETYALMTGHGLYERTHGRVEELLKTRAMTGGLPAVWVSPRITRCDEVYGQIEPFYDGWTMAGGSPVIDPLPTGLPPDASRRIEPLPAPRSARLRAEREEMFVRCDGVTVGGSGMNGSGVADLRTVPLQEAWRRVQRARRRASGQIEAVGVVEEVLV
jgi:hypothetical protein